MDLKDVRCQRLSVWLPDGRARFLLRGAAKLRYEQLTRTRATERASGSTGPSEGSLGPVVSPVLLPDLLRGGGSRAGREPWAGCSDLDLDPLAPVPLLELVLGAVCGLDDLAVAQPREGVAVGRSGRAPGAGLDAELRPDLGGALELRSDARGQCGQGGSSRGGRRRGASPAPPGPPARGGRARRRPDRPDRSPAAGRGCARPCPASRACCSAWWRPARPGCSPRRAGTG